MEEPSEQNQPDESKSEDEACDEPANESEAFWRAMQAELREELPTHVKNVLRLCRLDKPLTVRCISDETLDAAERFARRHMKYQLMGVDANLADYYGPYERAPRKFRFAVGDRILIKQMALLAKSKPEGFWRAVPAASADEPPPEPTSELEPSDDEERARADEPPSLEQERRKLADMVRAMLRKEEYSGGEEPRQVAARVKVRVELKPVREADGTTRRVVTGYIKCVFCATRLMIRKQSLGARKPRWVISNYRRHIRFHLHGRLRRTLGQELADDEPTDGTEERRIDEDCS